MINAITQNSACNFCFFQKNPIKCTAWLITLVAAAGAATIGVAIAGYIPMYSAYLGGSAIVLSVALLCVQKTQVSRQEQKEPVQEIIDNSARETVLSTDELLLRIFEHLKPQDLSNVVRVSKLWNCVAREPKFYRGYLAENDWCEENPNLLEAYRSLTALKRKRIRLHTFTLDGHYACSGNHLVTYASSHQPDLNNFATSIDIYQLKDDLSLRKHIDYSASHIISIGYYGETIYCCLQNGGVWIQDIKSDTSLTWAGLYPSDTVFSILVNQSWIITKKGFRGGDIKIWDKNTRVLRTEVTDLGAELIQIYKNQLIYTKTKDNNLYSYDLETGKKRQLTQAKKIESIDVLAVNTGVLLIQYSVGSFSYLSSNEVLRYDLEAGKWLPKTKMGMYNTLVAGLGDRIVGICAPP